VSATIVPRLFAQATALHAAGDLARAEALYQQVLAAAPKHPDALHLLGRLALDAGHAAASLPWLRAAIVERPRLAEFHASLADALLTLGQAKEAEAAARKAARLKPESAPIQLSHARALLAVGQAAAAAQACRRALARDPKLAPAHTALGAALLAAGDPAGAVAAFRAARTLLPQDADAAFNLGCALRAAGDHAAAIGAFRDAVGRNPGHAPAWGNLGLALQDDRDPEGGLAERAGGSFALAEAAFRRAAAIAPTADALCCLGNALRDQAASDPACLAEAESVLLRALAQAPDHREAHVALAMTRLLRGDLPAAWPDFAWRPAAAIGRARYKGPVWQGQTIAGTLLIYAEQGAGDFIQFSRFIAAAAARAGQTLIVVPPALCRLAASIPGVRVMAAGAPLPAYEAICADMDLPMMFGASLAALPRDVPYLSAAADEVAAWRARLAALPGRAIGLAWAGNRAYFHDAQRSIPAALLTPLRAVQGASFVSLQPGEAAPDWMVDWTADLPDFAATAALIVALDLMICVDSAVCHLAGALGRPVWLLNRYAPDWRWLLGRDDSPWYPTLRQFRQAAPGGWPGVIAEVKQAWGRSACPPKPPVSN
jgi:tetratricopeptide (TPR) repeat protein